MKQDAKMHKEHLQVAQELGLAAGEFIVEELQNAYFSGYAHGEEVVAVIAAVRALFDAVDIEERTHQSERLKLAFKNYGEWGVKYQAALEGEK